MLCSMSLQYEDINYFLINQHCKKYFIYLFLESGEGRNKERDRNIDVWEKLGTMHPKWGLGWQPRPVPWLGIKTATLLSTGQHSPESRQAGVDQYFDLNTCVCIQYLTDALLWNSWPTLGSEKVNLSPKVSMCSLLKPRLVFGDIEWVIKKSECVSSNTRPRRNHSSPQFAFNSHGIYLRREGEKEFR